MRLALLLCLWASVARADPECTLAAAHSMDELRRLPRVLVVVTSESCGACKELLPVLREVACEHHVTGAIRLADPVWYEEPSALPELQVYEKGRVVDRQCGAHGEQERLAIEHFLVRNGFVEGSLAVIEAKLPASHAGPWRQNLTDDCIGPARLDGADWSGIWAENAVFSGVGFRHAKLRNSVFENAFLSYVDFTGADLTTTNFDGARAVHVTCPDGRRLPDGPFACAKR
jgi:hypothetical protein